MNAVLGSSPDGWLLSLYFRGDHSEPGSTGPSEYYEEFMTAGALLAPVP